MQITDYNSYSCMDGDLGGLCIAYCFPSTGLEFNELHVLEQHFSYISTYQHIISAMSVYKRLEMDLHPLNYFKMRFSNICEVGMFIAI